VLNKKLNPKLLWMQFEDVLAPRLGLTVWDRVVYSYLLRHSLVVGKLRLHFAVMSVARDLGLSNGPVRQAVRRLDELGALRLLERSKTGHLVEMRLPEQIRALRPAQGDIFARHSPARRDGSLVYPEFRGATRLPRTSRRRVFNGAPRAAEEPPASALESTDFLKTWALRKTIHDRERGACFYCLRRTPANVQCLDHDVPRARFGRNSYRNLVSCCIECNTRKGDRPAPDFLRTLYRQGRLTPAELDGRLRALKDLAAGKLRPLLP
jgi:5-methylcytosine-specific restriction endonuclease McrA